MPLKKSITRSQMRRTIIKFSGVKKACICCGNNKLLVNSILQLTNSIELANAEDYQKLNDIKEKSIKLN